MRIASLLLFSAAIGVGWPVSAQTVLEKARRDELAIVRNGDPEMEKAFRKAKETLPGFIELIRNPRPTITSLAVKVKVGSSDGAEYFWLSSVTEVDGYFIGRLDNIPRTVKNVKQGQRFKIKQSDMVDWLYRENGKMFGNFTACALLKKEPPQDAAAFRARFGLDCD